MTSKTIQQQEKKLRHWPGITLALIQWILWFLVPKFATGGTAMAVSVFGGLSCGLLIIIWWAFFSRAKVFDRILAISTMVFAIIIFKYFSHESIATGLAGLEFFVYAIPVMTISFVIWASISSYFNLMIKRVTMLGAIIFASGFFILVKSDGITGNASAILDWRWAKTTEEKLLEEGKEVTSEMKGTAASDILWSGFRGNNRDNIIKGIKIDTDWEKNPPEEMWRQAVGPGCSSFAVREKYFYTQEQLGEEELVTCYDINTGKLVWKHQDKARFWDSHAGAGPRSTPTLKDSLVFTLGATGIVNVLNAFDGSVIWTRNAAEDLEAKLPGWGYASSPLVIDSVVIIAISGNLITYDIRNGEILWKGPDGGENYSSPQLFTFEGIEQVVFMSAKATQSYNPYTGEILWEYPWEGGAIVQPAITPEGDLLLSEGYKAGIHRFSVKKESGEWKLKEHWMTTKIKPDFNDFVVLNDYLYGFEGFSLTCIDLKDGERKWKQGRYGGQVLLLEDQNILFVITEKGELVLVEANPEELNELARMKAIEGKTWNHHVLVNDVLLVRNMEEMAAFKLKTI